MLLSNKVTGSVRGQYRHEVQSTEMNRDIIESKGSTNLGYSDAISRFWIKSSVDFRILHAKFHILGRKAQPVGITFSYLDKNVPFDGSFCLIFSDAPRYVLTGGNALRAHPCRIFCTFCTFGTRKRCTLLPGFMYFGKYKSDLNIS